MAGSLIYYKCREVVMGTVEDLPSIGKYMPSTCLDKTVVEAQATPVIVLEGCR